MNAQRNPVEEIGLVALRELRKNLRSIKGLALALLTVGGGGGIMMLVLPKMHSFDAKYADLGENVLPQLREEAINLQSRDPAAGHALANAPTGLLFLTLLTVSLTPAFLALTGFDLVAGDLQHRAVRYWTVRVRRASYIGGKFLGLWAAASAVVLLLHLGVWTAMVVRGDAPSAAVFGWGARLYAAWLPIAAVWAAVSILIGGLIGRPFLALVAILVGVFVLWASSYIGPHLGVEALMYIWPNEYLTLIAGGEPANLAKGLALAVSFVVSALGASVTLFTKRDV